jgi:hypothetical protein
VLKALRTLTVSIIRSIQGNTKSGFGRLIHTRKEEWYWWQTTVKFEPELQNE